MDFPRVNSERSKSTGNLSKGEYNEYMKYDNRANSESSLDNLHCVEMDNRSNASIELFDSGFEKTEGPLSNLEKKLDTLNFMLQEQQILLKSLRDEMSMRNLMKMVNLSLEGLSYKDSLESGSSSENSNERANSLLDAIELKHARCVDLRIKEAIAEFLQSDDLKDRVATTTADCVESAINDSFTKTFPSTYMPILENFHKRLLRYVTNILNNAFKELEGNSAYFYRSVHKTSRSLQFALENHENLLQNTQEKYNVQNSLKETLEDVLKNELAEWRHKLLNVLTSQVLPRPEFPERTNSPKEDYVPVSPSQPADPGKSIIEQLLKSAEIKNLITAGSINQSFEEALSSSDLSLVMVACRSADPVAVFAAPCCLQQSTLLSLVQQLATDMVHDTQLKCRYLEEAIINLDAADPGTQSYLPLVVGEVRKYLSKFLQNYPSHVAGRRISLIILAADNLLKK